MSFPFSHHSSDSTSVWQNGCSELKIYLYALVLWDSETENANVGMQIEAAWDRA